MLKCPHCSQRVFGQDLISGVCTHCQKRLTGSVDASFLDPEATLASDQDDSDSLDGSGLTGVGFSQADDSAVSFVSGSIADSAAAGAGVANEGLADSVADSAVGAEDPAIDESRATFISDEFDARETPDFPDAAPDYGTLAEVPPALQAEISNLRTAESDQWPAGASALMEPAGGGSPGATLLSDVDSSDDSVDESRGDRTRGDQTMVSDDGSFLEDGEDAGGRTFVSSDEPQSEGGDESLVKTMQSIWQDGASHSGMTLKGRETNLLQTPRSTLVIKPRSFHDVRKSAVDREQRQPEYELVTVLGEGGMGIVYDARQTSIDRSVAVKMLKAATAKSEKQRQKFLAEAVVTGDLDHPNIVPIYDVGCNEDGFLFYSMKKVEGTPWHKAIGQRSLVENLDILMKVADAVAFAHNRGVIHRDLKPENTMLGDFGEVLVMDWGLAQSSKSFRKAASITETSTMGGTPAYMAPEMATGPIDKISAASDIYLLGGILYEIITGSPPHDGKNAMRCLMAAARNEIVPTDKTGELVDIALKAMATEPADRYPDVLAFQQAIRDYQSHSESVLLSNRAEDDLTEANQSHDYQHFARALFGFQEAAELWPGNKRAVVGVSAARLAYAENALSKGDYDLGLSLLTSDDPSHVEVRDKLQAARAERIARQQRLKSLRKVAVGLVATVLVVVTGAFFWIRAEADAARKAEAVAVTERNNAKTQEELAIAARNDAVRQQKIAQQQRALAEQRELEATLAQREATEQRAVAVVERDNAETRRLEAEAARQQAEVARQQAEIAKRAEEYEAYVARIGLAAAKIQENAFETARELLEGCKPELRNWEWGRLMHLCSQEEQRLDAQAPLDALALHTGSNRMATGGWDGQVRIWDTTTNTLLHTLNTGGEYVHAVAFSPDGSQVATGGDAAAGFVQLWDLANGQRRSTLAGHTDAVLSVQYSRDGTRLLTSSYDNTARVFDLATGKLQTTLSGHTWWVWTARFSPDEQRVVTGSQDGTSIVWDLAAGTHSPPFTEHSGPVYAATFTPTGDRVITGGYDRRLLVWNPSELQPYDFKQLEQSSSVQQPTPARVLEGHTGAVRNVQFSAAGELLLTSGDDNTVRVWDFASGEVLKTLRGHASWVRSALFSPDETAILSASHDGTVRRWRLAGYEEFRTLQGRALVGHADAVLAATFSPDQQQVLTSSRDRTARIWSARTGEPLVTLEEGHSFLASTALFFEDSHRLATAAVDNTTRLWDVSHGGETHRLERTGRAAALAMAPDGTWLLTGGDQQNIQQWDTSTGARRTSTTGHTAEVTAVAISDDGRLMYSGDAKGVGRLWDAQTCQLRHELRGHSRRINAAVFLPGSTRLMTASGDNTVTQWETTTGAEVSGSLLKHPESVLTLALVPGAGQVLTSAADGVIRQWDLGQQRVVRTYGPFATPVRSLSIGTDATQLLTTHPDQRHVRLWSLATGRELQSPAADGQLGPALDLRQRGGTLWAGLFRPGSTDVLTVGGSEAQLWDLKTGRPGTSFSPHGTVAAANFSPDGLRVVTGSWDNSAKVWDARTGAVLLKLEEGHTGFINAAVFSPDGRTIITASDDHTAAIWDSQTGKLQSRLEGHTDRVRAVQFSRDGRWIVTVSNDKSARLWDATTLQSVREFTGHTFAVVSLDLSIDGTRLMTGSEDQTARIWDVTTGQVLKTLQGHTAGVTSVAFAPDASRVLTGSQDQAAKLWDTRTGTEILTLSQHQEDVTAVMFSRDGRQALTASRDGTAIIWLTVNWQPAVKTAQAE